MARDILSYPPLGSKGIVYARRSAPGERDQDESIPSQVERGQSWLREHGYEVLPAIEDYADGDSWNFYRAKLQELLRRAGNHEFQIVVVAAKDRLSRKAEHRPVIRFYLHEAGVKLHSLRPQEEDRDTPFAGLIEAIEDEQDEQERIKIRERLNNGKLHRVRQQKLMACSFPLYGYQWADPNAQRGKSRYEENPETAPAVRLAFRLATEGKTLGEICSALTSAGYPPPLYYRLLCGKLPRNRAAHKEWTFSSVYTMLTEPKYYGYYVANVTRTEKVKVWNEATRTWTTRKRHVKREEDDPLRYVFTEPTCPPLVSEETWLAAQAIIRQNARTAPRRLCDPEGVLLYGGFLICGFCHKPFLAFYDNTRQLYRYTGQSSAHKDANGNKCPGYNMSSDSPDLDRAVWDEVIRTFEQPEILRKQYAIWQAERAQNQTSEHQHLAAFRRLHAQAKE